MISVRQTTIALRRRWEKVAWAGKGTKMRPCTLLGAPRSDSPRENGGRWARKSRQHVETSHGSGCSYSLWR